MTSPDPKDAKNNSADLPDELLDALVVKSLRDPSVEERLNTDLAATTLSAEDKAVLKDVTTESILDRIDASFRPK